MWAGVGGLGYGGLGREQVNWPLDIILDGEACEKYREVGDRRILGMFR